MTFDMKHPKDRLERRSIQAKALEQKQFRQRIHEKKKYLKTQIEEKETYDELRGVSQGHSLQRETL